LRALWTTDYWRGVDAAGRVRELSPDRNLYRPVTVLSFWVTAAAAGVDAAAFRLVNLLLHALAALLVGVLCRLWGAAGGALVAVALMVVHPVATDVVNRIVGRADILAVVGVVGFLAVQRAALDDHGHRPGRAGPHHRSVPVELQGGVGLRTPPGAAHRAPSGLEPADERARRRRSDVPAARGGVGRTTRAFQ
jgi:hypothetical protein